MVGFRIADAITDIIKTNASISGTNEGRKFDICVQNPPYDNGLHKQFLAKMVDLSNIIISIQPYEWLISKVKDKNIIDKINDCYVNVDIDNGELFDAGIYSKLSIITINKNLSKQIIYKNIKFDSLYDIHHYSDDPIINEFYNIILKHTDKTKRGLLKFKDSFEDHALLYPFDTEFIDGKKLCTVKNSYYDENNITDNTYCLRLTMVQSNCTLTYDKNSNICIDTIKNLLTKTVSSKDYVDNKKPYFTFGIKISENKQEALNLFNYIQTDFVRACLYLIKTTMHLDRGELKYIPWQDFSDKHFSKSPKEIDDYLFNKYGIPDEIRKHMEEILPDYYNIR